MTCRAMTRNMLFIRKAASGLRHGQRVRTAPPGGRMGWWTVDSVGRRETVLVARGRTLRLTPGCFVLLPLSSDSNLS